MAPPDVGLPDRSGSRLKIDRSVTSGDAGSFDPVAVTVAGFIAIQQLRKVRSASKASREAADATMKALQQQDVTASLNEARSHLKMARVLMGSDLGAAGACVATSCNALTQVDQIRGGREDDEIVVHILHWCAAAKFLQSSHDPAPKLTRTRKMQSDIAVAATAIEGLIARPRYERRGQENHMSKISDLAQVLHEKTAQDKPRWDITDDKLLTRSV